MVKGADNLIALLQKAFDAELTERHDRPDGTIMHAEVRIGNSMVMISEVCDTTEGMEPMEAFLYLYVKDVDIVLRNAVEAGCKEVLGLEETITFGHEGELGWVEYDLADQTLALAKASEQWEPNPHGGVT